MSFTDFDVNDFMAQEARRSTLALADAQETNPDEASRARELAEATGADPVLVLSNLKEFEQQHKLGLGVSIAEENEFIANYLRSNQLAAKISSDDLGQLDATSVQLKKFSDRTSSTGAFLRAAERGAIPAVGSMPAMAAGASIGAAAGTAVFPGVGTIVGAIGGGLVGGLSSAYAIALAQDWLASKLPEGWTKGTGFDPTQAAIDEANYPTSAFLGGMAPYLLAMKPTGANLAMRGIGAGFSAGLEVGTELAHKGTVDPTNVALATAAGAVFAAPNRLGQRLFDLGGKIDPYLRAGKEPPVGIDPIIDAIKADQAQTDIDTLSEAVTEATKSATRERSPDMFADFVREHNDGDVYVSADKVQELYGDKPPTPDDNILGWVPRIREQLEVAAATGGDVAIPVADLMARIDKSVFEEIKDHLRTRPDGVTIEESKQPGIDVFHGSPADFEAFNSEFMGNGEGAQAYGYGHYLAENQQVADEYRKNVAHNKFLDIVKTLYGEEDGPAEGLAALKEWDKWSPKEKALLDALEKDDWLGFDYPHQAVRAALKEPQNLEMSPETQVALKNFGNLYKAKIKRAPEEFLDWDKPVGEQPVWEKLKAIIPQDLHNRLAREPGKFIYQDLPGYIDNLPKEQGASSKALSEAGIAGIRYLDQKSRGSAQIQIVQEGDLWVIRDSNIQKNVSAKTLGFESKAEAEAYADAEYPNWRKPTSNYVVFRDSDIEITHRNDTPVARAVQDLRKAAGFTPVQGRKATLRPVEDVLKPTDLLPETNESLLVDKAHAFDILDEKGEAVGYLAIAEEKGGKTLFVDDIGAFEGSHKLGPRAVRDILEQIKEQFPNAERVEGIRVSGAREKAEQVSGKDKAASELKAGVDLTKIKPRRKPKQLEMTELTRMEDRDAFEKGAAIGMTADQYKRYQKLIEKQLAEDQAYYTKKAVEEAKRRQTAEWKANEAAVRQEVSAEFRLRPDIQVDEFFREGKLLDKTMEQKPRFAEEFLTEEQKAALPKSYYGKNGMTPDDAATLLGYRTGADLIADMIRFNAERAASKMRPIDYTRRLVSAETERRMIERYGSLSENIIEEAKERVLSDTQIEMLHELTFARAMEAGLEYPIKKDDLVAAIKETFDTVTVKEAKSDKYFADAGRANKATQIALLKGDYAEAFRQQQRAYIATVWAREALGIEQAKTKLDKLADRYSKREVKGVEQETVNYIQKLLSEAGYSTRMTPEEINRGIEFQGAGSLSDYVAAKKSMLWEPVVSDALQALGAKPIEQMTIAEFKEFKDAIDTMHFIGREEKKINIAGEKMEFDDFKKQVIDNLKTLPLRPREKQGRWFYALDAELTNMEQIIKDLDLREELGPLYRAVIEPMMASKIKEYDMFQELSNHFKNTQSNLGRKWRKTLDDTIDQDFIIDPVTELPYDMTRENLIQVMLSWGNRSSIEKFSRSQATLELYMRGERRIATKEEAAIFEARTKALIDQHASKEDWQFVSEMWSPFKKWQPMSDTVSRNTSGIAPKWIDPIPVQTPFGEIEGGYWPVKYDRIGSNISVVEEKKPSTNALVGESYFRAATAKSYLKERTGYIDAMDLSTSLTQAAGVMQQMMHDIAFRDALIQAGKVFYDKDIRRAIRLHYGVEYEKQLVPWLKRIANKNFDDPALPFYNRWLRAIRVNLVGHALPLNLKVLFSPDVGIPDPRIWASFEANRTENVALAMEKSNEIRHMVYNMDRDYREQLEHLTTHRGLLSKTQRKAVEWGFAPMMKMSQEFRMASFVDEYNKAMAKGHSEHEASVIADSYVRERHGAASIVDLPSVMASSEGMKWLTMFQGYLLTMRNWQRQLPGQYRRREWGDMFKTTMGSVVVGAAFTAALFGKPEKDENLLWTFAKALMQQPLIGIPVVRDISNMIMENRAPTAPIASLLQAAWSLTAEAKRVYEGKEMKRPVQAAANVIGLSTGLPLLQIGKTAQFATDVARGKQRPKNIIDYWRGIVHGRMEPWKN